MPGRPRTKFKRVDELTARIHAFCDDLYDLMPRQYDERPSGDLLCESWRGAMGAAVEAWRTICELRQRLGEKAEIDGGL
ncbi:MAG: hypothetical protein IT427_16315 [Pirellulales bacterium]|nr:hypothetical protein [Pirellulales bacterium]